MLNAFASRQFARFLVTGGIAAVANFCSRIVYSQWLDFSSAVVLAYLTGMTTAFVLARLFVFQETTQSLRRSVMFFTLINILAVAQTWLVSMVLAYYVLPAMGVTRYVNELAHAAGVITPVFTSFLGHRRWSFR